MKKKLLIAISDLSIGGGQKMVHELVREIDRDRFEPVILCNGARKDSEFEKGTEKLCPVIYSNLKGRLSPLFVFKQYRTISKIAPDIIHAHLGGVSVSLPWALLHRKPVVVTAHTKPEKAFSKKNEKVLRFALKHSSIKLVAVSNENCKACKSYFRIDDDKCLYVNNGINVNRFFKREHEGFVFVNIARQDENKNQEMILRAFKRIHEEFSHTKLILAGDGPTHTFLKEYAEELEISNFVVFPGMVDCPEEFYSNSDVYLQSSHREALPLSIIEAMAAGLPVISTDVGGISDVVNKENGYLVSDGDDEAYYCAMRNMCLINSEVYNTMSSASLSKVQSFSSTLMANKYMEIYDDLLR